MKKVLLTLFVFALFISVLSGMSWAQCPADPIDRGECDSLNVICLDCDKQEGEIGPWSVRFPLLVSHDQIDPIDSIAGFTIPLTYTHTNPAAYCSVSTYWNTTTLIPIFSSFKRSIYRHMFETDYVPSVDTLYANRMALMEADESFRAWDFTVLTLDNAANFWFTVVPTGSQDQRWWEGDRVLLATMTLRVQDTMHVCIDSTFWAPSSILQYFRSDTEKYIPRHNLPQCFWVGPPLPSDFSIVAEPDTQEVQAGNSTDYNVTLTSLEGWDSPCTLTVSGLPTDASASFEPNPATPTGTSVMTVNTLGTTPPGTYDLTVSATEMVKGAIAHSVHVFLKVTPPPDFTIKLESDTLVVQAGYNVNSTVILTSLEGFASPCTLTISGLPTNTTAYIDPNPITPTDTADLKVEASSIATPGDYAITVTATEMTKGLVHSDGFVLRITPAANFDIALDPDSLEIQAGDDGNLDVNLTALYGFTSTCTLTITGLPTDASVDFDPDTLTPTGVSNLQISTARTTPVGVHTVTVTATEMAKGVVQTAQLILNVTPPPDFSIQAEPDSQEVWPGSSVDYDLILTSLYGFSSELYFAVSGLPLNASASISPTPVVPTDTTLLTITTGGDTPPGTYTITVNAYVPLEKGAGLAHSVDVVLVVLEPDFSIAVEPDSQDVQASFSADFDVILTSLNGFAAECSLAISGLPTDATGSFDVNPITPTDTSNLLISTLETTPIGICTVTVTATEVAKGKVHQFGLILNVTPPPYFTMAAEPDTQEVWVGNSVDFDIVLTSFYGYSQECWFSTSGLPTGATADFDPTQITPTNTSVMTITTTGITLPGTYTVTVYAFEAKVSPPIDSAKVVLVIPQPDYTVSASPETLQVIQGGESMYDVTLTSLYNFAEGCTLSVSGLPDYSTGTFNPGTLTPTDNSILTIAAAENTPLGLHKLTIEAAPLAGTKDVEHSVEVYLEVIPAGDFSMKVSPDTLRIVRTAPDEYFYTIELSSIAGFDSPCTLTVSTLPAGVTGVFDSPILVPTDMTHLVMSASQLAPEGFYDLTITATEMGSSKNIQHTKNVVLEVALPLYSFDLESDPDTQIVVVGDQAMFDITMIPEIGFLAPCVLYLDSGMPANASFGFAPGTIYPGTTSILTITTTLSTPPGVYDLEIRGVVTAPGETATDVIFVTLIVQDFDISASPDTQYITQGQSAGFDLVLYSVNGFAFPCTLTVSGLPDPPDSVVFDPAKLTPPGSSIMTVYTNAQSPIGWYNLTITAQIIPGAKSTTQKRTVDVVLKVNEASDVEDWTDDFNRPNSFALFQNQPNPFNPETIINYYLPNASQISLNIYNVLGQRVRILFEGYQEAGTHSLTWDGRNDSGAQMGSGIYFYRMQAGTFQETKKMTLMK